MTPNLPPDLHKFLSDAVLEAIKDAPVVVTQEKFAEALLISYARGVTDGARGVRL